jgi:hypothetical protein
MTRFNVCVFVHRWIVRDILLSAALLINTYTCSSKLIIKQSRTIKHISRVQTGRIEIAKYFRHG